MSLQTETMLKSFTKCGVEQPPRRPLEDAVMALALQDVLAAENLQAIRLLLRKRVFQNLLPTPDGVRLTLLVGLRVSTLVCEAIDQAHAEEGAQISGAWQDAALYRPCRRKSGQEKLSQVRNDGTESLNLLAVIDTTTDFMLARGIFSDYAVVILGLMGAAGICKEPDDLLYHRGLLVGGIFASAYMAAMHDRLSTHRSPDKEVALRYAKGNIKAAVLQTLSGPILGHHQIIVLNNVLCADVEMEPEQSFVCYRENLVWFADWATAGRADGDIMDGLEPLLQYEPREASKQSSDPFLKKAYWWRARNAIGDEMTRWMARFDHVTKDTNYVRHSAVLCDANESLRKLIMVSIGYCSFHCWPRPQCMSLTDYAEQACAYMGEMSRACASDHDTEAAIGEQNLMNWFCRDCTSAATCETCGPENAVAVRPDNIMRLAWGAHLYTYFSQRHHGFARRVDNLCERWALSLRTLPLEQVASSCTPVAAGDDIATIASKLLALCGLKPSDNVKVDLQEKQWYCWPRICTQCAFEGDRAQLFMTSVGAMRLAVMLPALKRPLFVNLLDKYGFRLFPALQSRVLVQCSCVPKWTADIMSHEHIEAGTFCGQSDCSVTSPETVWCSDDIDEPESASIKESLLRQAHLEAESYAHKTGQWAWLKVVSKPCKM